MCPRREVHRRARKKRGRDQAAVELRSPGSPRLAGTLLHPYLPQRHRDTENYGFLRGTAPASKVSFRRCSSPKKKNLEWSGCNSSSRDLSPALCLGASVASAEMQPRTATRGEPGDLESESPGISSSKVSQRLSHHVYHRLGRPAVKSIVKKR